MKSLFIIIVMVLATLAHAAPVPTGDFDCSKKKGSLHVSITSQGMATYIEVHHVMDQEEATLKGTALISNQKLSDGTLINRVRLPGSNLELFYDEHGNLGLDKDALACRKM